MGRMGLSNVEAIDTTRSLVRMLEAQWKEHMIVCVGQGQQEEEATTVTTKVENKLLTAVSRWQLPELDLGLQCRNRPSICPINTRLHRTSYTGMTTLQDNNNSFGSQIAAESSEGTTTIKLRGTAFKDVSTQEFPPALCHTDYVYMTQYAWCSALFIFGAVNVCPQKFSL